MINYVYLSELTAKATMTQLPLIAAYAVRCVLPFYKDVNAMPEKYYNAALLDFLCFQEDKLHVIEMNSIALSRLAHDFDSIKQKQNADITACVSWFCGSIVCYLKRNHNGCIFTTQGCIWYALDAMPEYLNGILNYVKKIVHCA